MEDPDGGYRGQSLIAPLAVPQCRMCRPARVDVVQDEQDAATGRFSPAIVHDTFHESPRAVAMLQPEFERLRRAAGLSLATRDPLTIFGVNQVQDAGPQRGRGRKPEHRPVRRVRKPHGAVRTESGDGLIEVVENVAKLPIDRAATAEEYPSRQVPDRAQEEVHG